VPFLEEKKGGWSRERYIIFIHVHPAGRKLEFRGDEDGLWSLVRSVSVSLRSEVNE